MKFLFLRQTHTADFIIIIFIYYKLVHEVRDRQTYSKDNKNSNKSTMPEDKHTYDRVNTM